MSWAAALMRTASSRQGSVDSTNFSIWTGSDSSNLQRRVATGQQVPNYSAGVNFRTSGSARIDHDGDLLFTETIAGPGINSTNNTGCWLLKSDSNTQMKVIARGDAAPGLPAGTTFEGFRFPSINTADVVVFIASFSGPGVDATNKESIWRWSPGAGLSMLLREGDQVQLAPGDIRTLSLLSFDDGCGALEDQAGGMFNGHGQFLLNARMTDGFDGTFILNVAVPEPGSAATILLLGAGLSAMRVRSRRR